MCVFAFIGNMDSNVRVGSSQRLIPVDSGNDLFIYKPPDVPSSKIYTIRPYLSSDESNIYDICRRTCLDGMDGTDCFRDCPDIVPDK